MSEWQDHYATVREMLHQQRPSEPVYCIFPHVYHQSTRDFLQGFPGRVMYAVKANADPRVIAALVEGGVRHFDCASLTEVRQLHALCPDGTIYFMNPVRLRGAAREAQQRCAVGHFVVDHRNGLAQLADETDIRRSVVFARMAVHHAAAMQDLSVRFGAAPADMPRLLEEIRESGAEPALAFNVGSSVIDPEAYREAIRSAQSVLEKIPFRLRLVDIGGGFARAYPGFPVPPVERYFAAIREAAASLALADDAEILCEPGRALAAPGMSAVTEVILRKEGVLYINDGMHGIFWELRYKGHTGFPVRTWRDASLHTGPTMPFRVHGPTCDSADTLPGAVELPVDIRPGDHIEFGRIGAYSLSGRTDFNGFRSELVVTVTGPGESPPGT